MATKTWTRNTSGSTGTWDTDANWSGGTKPVAGDDIVFDGTGISGCVFDVVPSVASITATSAYTGAGANDGHLDNATNDVAMTVTANVVLDNKEVSMGDALWTVAGNFDAVDVTTWNVPATGTLKMTGTSKAITLDTGHDLRNLTIDTGATITSDFIDVLLALVVDGDISMNSGKNLSLSGGASNVSVSATGKITGAGKLALQSSSKFVTQLGTVDIATMTVVGQHILADDSIVAATYDSATVNFQNANVTFLSGTYTFTGNVSIDVLNAGTNTYDNSANNPNFVFQGNVIVAETSGTIVWTKGTGTITLSGATSGTQTINFLGKSTEDIVVNDSGATKQFSVNELITESLTGTLGIMDFATNDPDVTVSGDVILDNDQVDMSDGTWTISGNFDYADVGTFNENSSTVIMDGTAKTITGSASNELSSLTIRGTITTTASFVEPTRTFLIETGATFTSDDTTILSGGSSGDLKIQTGGTLNGSDRLTMAQSTSISQMDGTISVAKLIVQNDHAAAGDTLVAAQYDPTTFEIESTGSGNRNVVFDSGTVTITGNLLFDVRDAGNLTLLNSTSNPNFVLEGNITITETSSGVAIWAKGTGSVTLSGAGSGTQTIDFNGSSIEDLVINDSGATKQIQNSFTMAALTTTAGTLDDNGKTLSVSGDISFASGTLTATGLLKLTGATTGVQTVGTSGATLNNLEIDDSGATKQLTSDLVVNDITLIAGALDGNNKQISVSGSWTASTGFTYDC